MNRFISLCLLMSILLCSCATPGPAANVLQESAIPNEPLIMDDQYPPQTTSIPEEIALSRGLIKPDFEAEPEPPETINDLLIYHAAERYSTPTDGTAISFQIGERINTYVSSNDSIFGNSILIDSLPELQAVLKAYPIQGNQAIDLNYTESFFQENTLLAFFFVSGSGSISYRINSLVRAGNDLYFDVTKTDGGPGPGVMSYWYTLLSIPENDIQGIDRFFYHLQYVIHD